VSAQPLNRGGAAGRFGPATPRACHDFIHASVEVDDPRPPSKRAPAVVFGLAWALGWPACASPMPSALVATQAHPAAAAPEFTLVALPDTQYYSAAHPEIFRAQTQWITSQQRDRHIAVVVHEGDIVDADEPWQWARAFESLHPLEGVVPCLLSTGNHDYTRTGNTIQRTTQIGAYFPEPIAAPGTRAQGTFEPGQIENSFQIIDAPGGAWLIVALEFGPRDAALAWADGILKQHRSMPAIVVTHAYLRSDDTRYDVSVPALDWNPHRYLKTETAGAVNDGQEIWRKLIVGNANVRFVLCGHDLGDGVGRLTSVRPDGSRVHQILANYQMGALGGAGYLRLMRFLPARHHVEVQTYSPFLDRFKTDPANMFDLDY
jgi:hypothetical protein